MIYNDILNDDKEYFMPIFGNRFPIALDHGKGCYLYDTKKNEYLDFASGIATNCLGYAHDGFTSQLKNQVDKLIHCSNLYYIKSQSDLAKKICNLLKEEYKCFFANSGAEANECAIKLVRKYFKEDKKYKILTLRNSFHGRTMATLSATGQEKFHKDFTPLCPEFDFFSSIEELYEKIDAKTGAVMIELIQGEGGVNPLLPQFVKNIESICKEKNLLLIVDEIQTGIGRTGKMFAFENYDISPDIFTLAKSLGNGVPIGACVAKSHIQFSKGDHGSTFGGNPLACCAANYVVDTVNQDMLNHINQMSEYLFSKLKSLSPRGKGLLVGFSLDKISNIDIVKGCLNKGLLLVTAGFNTVRLLPPYIITKEEIDKAVKIIFDVIKELEEE